MIILQGIKELFEEHLVVRDCYYLINPGGDQINKFLSRTITQLWNKALWLDDASHMISFNQS